MAMEIAVKKSVLKGPRRIGMQRAPSGLHIVTCALPPVNHRHCLDTIWASSCSRAAVPGAVASRGTATMSAELDVDKLRNELQELSQQKQQVTRAAH